MGLPCATTRTSTKPSFDDAGGDSGGVLPGAPGCTSSSRSALEADVEAELLAGPRSGRFPGAAVSSAAGFSCPVVRGQRRKATSIAASRPPATSACFMARFYHWLAVIALVGGQ